MVLLRAPFVLAAALLCAAAPAAAPALENATGGIYITTLPAGADIWIDGTYVGHSPAVVDALPRGRHTITVTKTGWEVKEFEVDVQPGVLASTSVNLVAGAHSSGALSSGNLNLRGVETGRVLIDGVPLNGDVHRLIPLLPGPHRVTLVLPGSQLTRNFKIWPDTTTEVILKPPAASENRSAVVAPAKDYLPDGSYQVEGTKIVIRYGGHLVVAHVGESLVRFDGAPVTYDGAPQTLGGRLFLPLELLEKLTSDTSSAK